MIEYIDQKLANKVTRQDLAKRLRSEAQLQFCNESAMKNKQKHEQQKEMKRQSRSQRGTGSETRVLPKSPVSPEMTDFPKSLYIPSPDKSSTAQTTSIFISSDDKWREKKVFFLFYRQMESVHG